jgi:ribosomal protein L3
MTQVFTEDGLCVPVTVIAVREGNIVTQVRWVLFFSHPRRRVVSRRLDESRARLDGRRARRRPRGGGDVHRRIVTNRTRDDERRRARAM